jgi:hypothetical protein
MASERKAFAEPKKPPQPDQKPTARRQALDGQELIIRELAYIVEQRQAKFCRNVGNEARVQENH